MCNWPPEFDPARFLRIACRAASRIARNRLVIEEAAEQAVHRFHVAVLTGEPVHHPEAWICTVARRTAWTLMRSGRCRRAISKTRWPSRVRRVR